MKFKLVTELPGRAHKGRQPDPVLAEFADFLRANPGMWSEYPNPLTRSSRYRTANQINKGEASKSFSDGEFIASVRGEKLYVKYVGKKRR